MGEHARLVPRDPEQNLEWRERMLHWSADDPSRQDALKAMCSDDILFWINAFGWTFDPRRTYSVVPFATWPFQDRALADLDAAIGSHDVSMPKSRDMGASWMLCSVFLWRWMFRRNQSFLLVSRNEDYVDRTGNPKSLFWKIDHLLKYMPEWLLPRRERAKLRLTNLENGSTIDGESTTGDVARGDRRTAIGLDEFAAFGADDGWKALAATRDATRCRIFNSTPAGVGNAFHAVCTNEHIPQIRLHWTDHPEKASGLYYDDHGKARSPWYDNEVRRCATPMEIAQELDISFEASQAGLFEQSRLLELTSRCRPAVARGELIYDDNCRPLSWDQRAEGRFHLWMLPDASGSYPTDRRFAMGADISTGSGSSNSVLCVVDCKTGEQVLEIASSDVRPDQFARLAVAVGWWFKGIDGHGAQLIWEHIGPGKVFGDVVVELGYRNLWRRSNADVVGKPSSSAIGWYPNREEKVRLYGHFRKSLDSGAFVPRSRMLVDEMRELIYDASGGIVHVRAATAIDPSGAKGNHGDRATAAALASLASSTQPKLEGAVLETYAMPGSFGHRRNAAAARARRRDW